MGCDINAAVEYRTGADQPWQCAQFPDKLYGQYDWHDKPFTFECDFSRDYDLFAILGNVRNGSGFAGIKTGEGFEPMSDDRGVPDDISDEASEVLSNEHSATWVTLAEILAYDWDRSTGHNGVVDAVEFASWDVMKQWDPAPSSYSGDVGGGSVRHVSVDEMRAAVKEALGNLHPRSDEGKAALKEKLSSTFTRVEWTESYSKAGEQLWTLALPKMLNLGREHGFDNVRLVMDFDS